jgi:hypothetical protein
MSSPTSNARPAYAREEPWEDAGEPLRQLRLLLLATEQRQILSLRRRLDDPAQKAEELSGGLAEALAIRCRRDRKLQAALQPLVEDALRVAAVLDPEKMAASLAPIFGVAVIRAAARSLRRGAGALHETLVSAFLLESLRWRFAARRTGQPLGVVALTRSRRFRVERVCLIHHGSGIVLGQAGQAAEIDRDAELIAAIQTVSGPRRSVARGTEGELEVMELGGRSLWLRRGALATLAAVVAGRPPAALGQLFESEIEAIHQEFGPGLRAFEGDPLGVPGVAAHLRGCLLGGRKAGARQSYGTAWAMAAITMAVAGSLVAGRLREDRNWTRYLDRLRSEPGIAVIEAQHHWSTYTVRGLRDPLAADPQRLLSAYGVAGEKVASRWEPYLSLDPGIAAARRLESAAPGR